MSNQINDQLKDRAWDLAVSMFDVTVPDEVIAVEAEKLYQIMLGREGHMVPMTDQQLHQGQENFINSFSN